MLEQLRLRLIEKQGPLVPDEQPFPARLLVIDDDHLHRLIICRTAAKAGFLPSEAASFEDAARLVQELAFDCITLDLSLGPHAGVDLLRHLWVIKCKAPIMIISGSDDAICKETMRIGKSLNLNIWELVPKPVDLSVLRQSLDQLRAQREAVAHGIPA